MEIKDLPTEINNLIFRFNSHPIADIIRPCIIINKDDTIRLIKHKDRFYHHSRQYTSNIEEDLYQCIVMRNRIRTKINKVFTEDDIPNYFDESFMFEHRFTIKNFTFFLVTLDYF